MAPFSSMMVPITASAMLRAGDDDAVVFEQHPPALAERARDAGAHVLGADQIDGVGIGAERLIEQRARAGCSI